MIDYVLALKETANYLRTLKPSYNRQLKEEALGVHVIHLMFLIKNNKKLNELEPKPMPCDVHEPRILIPKDKTPWMQSLWSYIVSSPGTHTDENKPLLNSENNLKDFRTSLKAFSKLNDHLAVLKNDGTPKRERSHTYCFGLFDLTHRKHNQLEHIIYDLKKAATIDDFQRILQQVNNGLSKYHVNGMSYRQHLNVGQNIITLIFGVFGMQTTTVNLLDELNEEVTKAINAQQYCAVHA